MPKPLALQILRCRKENTKVEIGSNFLQKENFDQNFQIRVVCICPHTSEFVPKGDPLSNGGGGGGVRVGGSPLTATGYGVDRVLCCFVPLRQRCLCVFFAGAVLLCFS